MSKKRIHELAKEYGMSGKELADKLRDLGFTHIKSHMTALDEFEELQVEGVLGAHGFRRGEGAGGSLENDLGPHLAITTPESVDLEAANPFRRPTLYCIASPEEVVTSRSFKPKSKIRFDLSLESLHEAVKCSAPVVLTVVHSAAVGILSELNKVRGARDDGDSDDWFEDAESNEVVQALNEAVAPDDVFVTLDLEEGNRGDPIYHFDLGILDAEEGRNGRKRLRLRVAAKTDVCLLIGAQEQWSEIPRRALRLDGELRFGTGGYGNGRPMPRQVVEVCRRTRDRGQLREDVANSLGVWERFLNGQMERLDEDAFEVAYDELRSEADSAAGSFVVCVARVSKDISDRLCRLRRPLEVMTTRPAKNERGFFGAVMADARVRHWNPETSILRLRLERDEDGTHPDVLPRLPKSGWLCSQDRGTKFQLERQLNAIRRVQRGEAWWHDLDRMLFGGDLVLPDVAPAPPIPLEDCANPNLTNDDQRAAVAEALASPDCYFLQGPPGTGKTTFISELCFQVAKRGRRVLVTSQANLAVDNALSRLGNRREVRAVRLGRANKVEEEGLEFLEDNAATRWLRSVARDCRERRAGMVEVARRFDEAIRHRDLMQAWADAGCSNSSSPELSLTERVARLVEDERHEPVLNALDARLDQSRDALLERERQTERLHASANEWRRDKQHLEDIQRSGFDSETTLRDESPRHRVLCWMSDLGELLDGRPVDGDVGVDLEWSDLRCVEKALREGDEAAWQKEWGVLARELGRPASHRRLRGVWAAIKRLWLRRRTMRLEMTLRHELLTATQRWPILRSELEKRVAELDRDLDTVTRELRQAEQQIEKMGRLELGESERQALGGDQTATVAEPRCTELRRALQIARNKLDAQRRGAGAAAWGQLREASRWPSDVSSRSGLDDALKEIEAQTGPFARYNHVVALQLLDEWIARLEGADLHADEELRRVFFGMVNVVGTTCSQAGSSWFRKDFKQFDVVIVDEVSKATPSDLLMPCLLGKKVVLVGDHKQLQPIMGREEEADVVSDMAGDMGMTAEELKGMLVSSLFARRFEWLADRPHLQRARMLGKQYRMHSEIMRGINPFYDGQLSLGLADQDEQRRHGLSGLQWLPEAHAVAWINIPDLEDWYSSNPEGSSSQHNPQEAKVVVRVLRDILPEARDRGLDVGVITPYAEQVKALRRELNRSNLSKADRNAVGLRIATVDRFQGMERDVIVLSLCTNGRSPSQFLREPNRINVAMSRSRRLLVVVGSKRTFFKFAGQQSHYAAFANIARENGAFTDARRLL